MKKLIIPTAFTLCLMPFVSVHAEIMSSPLRTYSQSPYQSTSLTARLRSAFTPEHTEIYANYSMASVWAETAAYTMDYYQNQAWTGIEWSPLPNVTTALDYQYSWADNNHLDSLTISFHDLFGIGQNGRDHIGRHQFNIDSDEYDIHINDFEDEVMAKALHGYLQVQLWQSAFDAFAIGGSLYYNKVGSGPFKTSSFESGVQANYSIIAGRFSLFATYGLTYRKANSRILNVLKVNNSSWSAAIGAGYRLTDRHEMVLEYHAYEGLFLDVDALSETSNEVILGYRYYLPFATLEASMNENIINMDNTADIAFTMGARVFF